MQMLLRAVLVDALHAALEHAEIAFDGVRRDAATDILASLVIDATVAEKRLAELATILRGFVRHDVGLAVHVAIDDRYQLFGAHVVHDKGTNLAALTVNERQDRNLVRGASANNGAGLAANERLID